MGAKKILVVEDNAITLKILSSKLKAHGYDVLAAVDSSEAVAAVRKSNPDLIVLDLNLPTNPLFGGAQWDGFGVMAWLKRMEPDQHIPTVVITSSDPQNTKQRALDAGAVAFFQKPPQDHEFFAAIDTALAGRDTPSSPPA
jgi:CheY-like chemotaxis protein